MPDTPNQSPSPKNSATGPIPAKSKRVRGPARKRLRKAVERTVRDRSSQIAKALVDHAIGGNVNCAKLLFSLIEKMADEESDSRAKRRCLELASEPQWQDPDSYLCAAPDDGPDADDDLDFSASFSNQTTRRS